MRALDVIPADYAWLAGLVVFFLTVGVGYYLLNRPRQPVRAPASLPRWVSPPQPAAVDPFQLGGFGEKRTSLRRSGAVVKVAVADTQLNELEHGWIVDRSMGGLGISLSKPLAPGTMLNVRPQTAGE